MARKATKKTAPKKTRPTAKKLHADAQREAAAVQAAEEERQRQAKQEQVKQAEAEVQPSEEERGRRMLEALRAKGSMMPAAVQVDAAREVYLEVDLACKQGEQKLAHLEAQMDSLRKAAYATRQGLEVAEADRRTAAIVLEQKLNALRSETWNVAPKEEKKVYLNEGNTLTSVQCAGMGPY